MKFKIEMNAEELARGISSGALQALVGCDSTKQKEPQNIASSVEAPVNAAHAAIPKTQASPAEQKAEVASVDTGTGMITGEAQPNDSVPAPKYTHQKLAMMGAQLVGAGKKDAILDLLKNSFKVNAVTELAGEAMDAYGAKLIEMGADPIE